MKAGIYLHIPFCKSRCSYCDFATDVYRNDETVERYVNAIVKEIQSSKFKVQSSRIEADTIYFGGGTPSLLSAKQLGKILEEVHKKFAVEKSAEITMEMNPATISLETLREYKSLGVNRASFGVQTFNEMSLKLLARGHDANDARKTFELLRQANFENVSFDLIAGLPHQTLADWEINLTEAMRLKPEHISLYLLEIHEGTPLAEQIRSKRQPNPNDDLAGEMYELMIEKLTENGYEQYEISNFSKSGFESKHNNKYWEFAPYFSFGVSAHSFDGKSKRWANERDTAKYVSLIENEKSPIAEETELDEETLRGEYIFLQLRLNKGLDLQKFEKKFGFDLMEKCKAELSELSQNELIEMVENNLRLTEKGRLFSNEVFRVFV
jgi:oxygen-independent coproporphyrinogen-3 oxidase